MRIVTRRRLLNFIDRHPKAAVPLERWYRIMKHHSFVSFSELRSVFPSADKVGKLTIFYMGGNAYRLLVATHYNRSIIYIRDILTHKEYDKGQ